MFQVPETRSLVNQCTFYRPCNVCKKNHNTLLHVSKDDKEETTIVKKYETNNVVAMNSISEGGYKSILNILPVNAGYGESYSVVVTYAMLNSVSTTSICKSSLVSKLNAAEAVDFVELRGINSLFQCVKWVGPLEVQGLNETKVFTVDKFHVLDNLSDVAHNFPNNAIAKRYPHLNDLTFPRLESHVKLKESWK